MVTYLSQKYPCWCAGLIMNYFFYLTRTKPPLSKPIIETHSTDSLLLGTEQNLQLLLPVISMAFKTTIFTDYQKLILNLLLQMPTVWTLTVTASLEQISETSLIWMKNWRSSSSTQSMWFMWFILISYSILVTLRNN